ncbi:thioesterase family protein [Picosynechococcus sp. PCC 7117]|uniref:acyl-CoA thioesterase n=1 Tax=Picosynechococcus sp. PCC 7117 TaxID=195498 RepID=UPI0008107CAC|nr:thioesterase family protein [Picosynechococcus sp. PCC 7117]ANV87154.1 1,4-dihydroxy-2-naphthoyl-CoA hydrolase [Picosynechococcus sp. PCC 7117]
MAYAYRRTIHLADTDAAGVVYFAQLLHICHEAYEICLTENGMDWSGLLREGTVALPIVHSAIDFLRPITWGDRLDIQLYPELENFRQFKISYRIFKENQDSPPESPLATALTRHVAINPRTRQRCSLPPVVETWLRNAPKIEDSKI